VPYLIGRAVRLRDRISHDEQLDDGDDAIVAAPAPEATRAAS
jgi:hypothetical protein